MDLEQFIQNNRAAFEQDGPSADLWLRIADQLPDDSGTDDAPTADVPDPTVPSIGLSNNNVPKPRPEQPFRAVHRTASEAGPGRMQWRWAASVALLLLTGAGWWLNTRYGVTQQPEIVAISPSYAKEVTHYASLIDDKQDELRQLTKSNPDLYQQFSGDLKSLETSYESLKADLPQTPNQDVLIQAMIRNLQLQIDLLNEQLRVGKRIKQQTTSTNELPAKPI
ncbi:hypothetical protein FAES_1392 [Fibrella aestuarina BUZ 2]|uniref:Anti-sigma factor n=1 Tax=Fibrella aestuarina BUZ 2 TaxID=1166018 RepID=I0K5J9_9BACT|nr:hypothetical protein [Fibrella aestuarina]CCG99402.1 hypothetical protein FAES_1392 [Fibrella aestuarina BUZ 2]